MNYAIALIIPLLFLTSFAYALKKKVNLFDAYAEGVKGAIPLVTSIFPYIVTVSILSRLLNASGLGARLADWLSPAFAFAGVPHELAPLLLIKPLSGSGAIAVLAELLGQYGVDSYIGRCACVIYGSSETVFYIGAVYFAGLKRKKLSLAIAFALLSYILSVALCCLLCKFM